MTAATCAACGETLRPTARFCGACGTPSPVGPGTVGGEQDPNDTVIIATTGANQPDPDRTVVTDAGLARTPPGTDPAPGDPGITMTGAALPPLGPPPAALVVEAKTGSRPPVSPGVTAPPVVAPPPGPPPVYDPHGAPPPPQRAGPSAAFVLAGVAVVALLVIGLVVALSRSGDDDGDAAPEFTDTGASADQASGSADTAPVDGTGSDGSSTSPSTVAEAGGSSIPSGPSRTIEPTRVAAPLQTEPSVNGCDQTTTFEPANLLDHTPETAWRTAGDGTGRRITLNLGVDTRVTSVGLINGYAKVDPCDGTDRYFQGRRVTAVRWTFDDGTEIVQDLDENLRSVQSTAVDVVTLRVQLEILGTTAPGERDFTPISDIEIEGVT